MDGYLVSNLNTAKSVIRKDWDMSFVVDGSEGSGKSVITMQMAYYCDPTFTLDRIVFTPRDLRKVILESEPYQAVVYDEAYTGLSSRATMSLINRTIISMLAEIRQRNLFVFVVMPCYFDLDKYVALWRSRALIHVYTGPNFARGYFAFYNSDKKKDLYIQGKKFYTYARPKPNFIGRFTNHYVVDEKAYRLKKKNSLIDREKEQLQKEIKREVQTQMVQRLMALPEEIKGKIPNHIKAEIIGVTERHWYRLVQDYENAKEFS